MPGKALAVNLSEEGDGSARPEQYLLYNCILNFWSLGIISWVAGDAGVGWWSRGLVAVAVLGMAAGFGCTAAVREEEGTYFIMCSAAGNRLLGVKESLFPGKWGSASLEHCLTLLWFLRPKKIPQEQISASQNIPLSRSWKETLGPFFLLNHLALSL